MSERGEARSKTDYEKSWVCEWLVQTKRTLLPASKDAVE